ncbi:unnamed protein product [Allacma fusca]|uniref:Uncharacterized protein n=1 Tax=Allacma fusca TaxID=39272 RepID=A0A8J2LAU3_9HEXA|nr:unnamed protein product [Allacma fusca]
MIDLIDSSETNCKDEMAYFPLPPNLSEIFEHGFINTADSYLSAVSPGDFNVSGTNLPYYGINSHEGYFDGIAR